MIVRRCVTVAIVATIVHCVVYPDNPCPDVFQYKVDEAGYQYGELRFPNDRSGNFLLEVNVSIVGFHRNKNVKLELKTGVDDLMAGAGPLYRVHFPFQDVLPKLTRARFNGIVYCSGPPEPLLPGRAVTNMWATTMFYTDRPVDRTSTTTTPTTTSASPLIDVRLPEECGRVDEVQELVVNGQATEEGEFPWLAALMYRNGFNYEFRCTANLISDRHVITAAHCVQLYKAPLVPREDMLVVLGKRSLANWANGGAALRDVARVAVHPLYRQDTGDRDVALLALDRPVAFSRLVAPVCLWAGPTDLEGVEGENGTVAGWGRDERGPGHVAAPRKVVLPVVSQEECLRSNAAFAEKTSEVTFCAGDRDGRGPCEGDSGGGFVVKRAGRWTLRGVVSFALEDPVTRTCDVGQYFIFADVAKLGEWVREEMRKG